MPCIFMAASVSIQQYFDLKRATASSISVVGAAMGMFIWPPLCQVLINHYGWRGSFTCLLPAHILLHKPSSRIDGKGKMNHCVSSPRWSWCPDSCMTICTQANFKQTPFNKNDLGVRVVVTGVLRFHE